MNREEWESLPPRIALGLLYEILHELGSVEAPKLPRPPKYDGKLSRKGGTYCWMSEMDLNSLRYWHGLKTKEGGDQRYAERDEKIAKNLAAWITWRTVFPDAVWFGTRGDDRATAKPPSREPALHSWDNSGRSNGSSKGSGSRSGSQRQAPSQDDEEIDENDIPF